MVWNYLVIDGQICLYKTALYIINHFQPNCLLFDASNKYRNSHCSHPRPAVRLHQLALVSACASCRCPLVPAGACPNARFSAARNAELIGYLEQQVLQLSQVAKFVEYYSSCYVNKYAFDIARENIRSIESENLEAKRRSIPLYFHKVKCDTESPICLHVHEIDTTLKRRFSYFLYKEKEEPQVIPDYFTPGGKMRESQISSQLQAQHEKSGQLRPKNCEDSKSPSSKTILDQLVVGRQAHICQYVESLEFRNWSGNHSQPTPRKSKERLTSDNQAEADRDIQIVVEEDSSSALKSG